ncbi:hypothetical protein [Mesobacillus foraminis]|uniref:hypothetical protein n=1 Tax=Mesobacillus foraminis TaxID=279826 RepID=UPI00104D9909|nr:hypothetical protein [Mesobacillus foraminis]
MHVITSILKPVFGWKACRLLGISWSGEILQELATGRLSASSAESEATGTEINSLLRPPTKLKSWR